MGAKSRRKSSRRPGAPEGPRPSALAICTRVGEATVIPPRTRLADCGKCGCSIWVTERCREMAASHGLELLTMCGVCALGTPV